MSVSDGDIQMGTIRGHTDFAYAVGILCVVFMLLSTVPMSCNLAVSILAISNRNRNHAGLLFRERVGIVAGGFDCRRQPGASVRRCGAYRKEKMARSRCPLMPLWLRAARCTYGQSGNRDLPSRIHSRGALLAFVIFCEKARFSRFPSRLPKFLLKVYHVGLKKA